MLTLFDDDSPFLTLRLIPARMLLLFRPRMSRYKLLHPFVAVVALCLAPQPVAAGKTETDQPTQHPGSLAYTSKSHCEADTETLPCTHDPDCDLLAGQAAKENGWMDTSHEFVTSKSDALAGWMDGFFGTQRADDEAARSFLRLRFQHDWDEEEGHDIKKPKLRGKVDLPRLDKRLGLIFSDAGDDTVNEEVDNLLADEQPNNDVALQYTGVDKGRSRLDFKLSLPSFKLKTGVRYRYKYPFSEKLSGRFTEELIFRDGKGFETTTRLELDDALSKDLLLRWSNRFRYGQRTAGIEWNSTIGLGQRIDEKQAISYFASVSGKTKPEFLSERAAERLPGEPRITHEKPEWLTEAYGVGVLYRLNFFRRWLFVEIEPAVLWRRHYAQEDNREPVGVITARLEILFDKEHSDR